MQQIFDLFAEACANFGLTISIKKTEVMFQLVQYLAGGPILNGSTTEFASGS